MVCMCDSRDTIILPCRHLCLCNACADSLRYQANNCPICRAPFRALLQVLPLTSGLRIRDVYPGSEFFPSRIQEPKPTTAVPSAALPSGLYSRYRPTSSDFCNPGSRVKKLPDPGSESAAKNLSIFNPNNCFKSSRKNDSGCSSRIRILIFYPSRIPDSGSRGQKGTGSRNPGQQLSHLPRSLQGSTPGTGLPLNSVADPGCLSRIRIFPSRIPEPRPTTVPSAALPSGLFSRYPTTTYQCCGSGMFIPDPNFSILDQGSKRFRIPDSDPHQRS